MENIVRRFVEKHRNTRQAWDEKEDLDVLRLVNERYWRASDYCTYQLFDKSHVSDGQVKIQVLEMGQPIAGNDKGAAVQPYGFCVSHQLLSSFKMACKNNAIHEGAAMQFVPHFMK